MRVHPFLAALLAGVPCLATAQSTAPLELGVPGDMVFVQPSAFTGVYTEEERLFLIIHPGFFPVVMDYINLAPREGISVTFCDRPLPPLQPTAQMASGTLVIPMGDAETASRTAGVMAGEHTCEDIPQDPVTITDLLPTPSGGGTPLSGLTIRSPSDTYDAMVEEVMEARVGVSEFDGAHVINLAFGPGLEAWFSVETEEHVGEQIEILVCGEVVTAPTVQTAILGGQVQISGGFTKPEAEEVAARIRGDLPCG